MIMNDGCVFVVKVIIWYEIRNDYFRHMKHYFLSHNANFGGFFPIKLYVENPLKLASAPMLPYHLCNVVTRAFDQHPSIC